MDISIDNIDVDVRILGFRRKLNVVSRDGRIHSSRTDAPSNLS